MKRFVLSLLSMFVANAAFALPVSINVLNPQVLPANRLVGLPAVADTFVAGGYPIAGGICSEWGHRIPCNQHYTTTRASTKYVSASDGMYVSVPVNTLALGSNSGASIEDTRTNDALWSRDMTNAAWVKTTMTTALNAVGIDGIANSATTLTATGALAMAVQTVTLGSQADNYSVFLKRVTGSGTISLCLAATACGTATPCTVTSTTAFTRCTVTATVLNPIVGIQIVTNGDAVIADFNQMEPGSITTSPILTTSATATRSADQVIIAGPAASLMASGVFSSTLINSGLLITNAGILTGNTDTSMLFGNNATIVRSILNAVTLTATLGSGTVAGTTKTSLGISAAGRSLVSNNGTLTTDANTVAANTSFALGGRTAGNTQSDGSFTYATFSGARLSDAILKAQTQ